MAIYINLGSVGITLNVGFAFPADLHNPDDLHASERDLLFNYGWFAHPVVYGDYPEVMKKNILEKSLKQGNSTSRLPEFTEEEKQYIKGNSYCVTTSSVLVRVTLGLYKQ